MPRAQGVGPAPDSPRRRAWPSQRQAFACGVMPPCATPRTRSGASGSGVRRLSLATSASTGLRTALQEDTSARLRSSGLSPA